MSRLLIASSPVEIEAMAQEAGLDQAARDAALALFHELTDRLGHAARTLRGEGAAWPKHRFYFGPDSDPELGLLRDGLRARADFAEIAAAQLPSGPSGLFVQDSRAGFTAILVGHETHDGLPSPTPS